VRLRQVSGGSRNSRNPRFAGSVKIAAEGPKERRAPARPPRPRADRTARIIKNYRPRRAVAAAGAFQPDSMVCISALLALFGFLSSIQATTRSGHPSLDRSHKERRPRKADVRQQAGDGVMAKRLRRLSSAIRPKRQILTTTNTDIIDAERSKRSAVEIAYRDEGEGRPSSSFMVLPFEPAR